MKVILATVFFACFSLVLRAQDTIPLVNKIANFPLRFLDGIQKKSGSLENKILNYSEKALKRLERQEKKLYKKLYKTDSVAARQLLESGQLGYQNLRAQLAGKGIFIQGRKQYLSHFDTLNTSLKFISQNASQIVNNQEGLQSKLKNASSSLEGLSVKLQQADAIQKYLKDRKQLLRDQLQRVGLVKELRKYNQQAYYYAEQIKEYKAILEDPKKLEQKAIRLLRKLPLFQKFMQQHSELAALFPEPTNYGTGQSLAGLQTRASLQNSIQQQIAAGGPNAQAMIQQNIHGGLTMLNSLKDRVNKNGGSDSDIEMPEGFKPNNQRVKSFWKRLDYSTNLQTLRSNSYFPTTTDIGLSVGYKFTEKIIIGLGSSIKIGWGQNIRNVDVSAEGLSIRSFTDVKLRGSFYMSGGLEYNYQPVIQSVQQLKNLDAWRQSGLIGISKVISLKSKFFKNTSVRLLWDFLSYRQRPVEQPVKFRIAYGIK